MSLLPPLPPRLAASLGKESCGIDGDVGLNERCGIDEDVGLKGRRAIEPCSLKETQVWVCLGRQTYPEGQTTIQPAPSEKEAFCELPGRAQAHVGMSGAC